jgi:hypothetical protein
VVSGERNCTTIAVERWVKALTVITISVERMSDNAIRFTYRIIYKTYLIIITIMNNTIQIFENKEFGNIRTMRDEKGEPMFCGKDVCDALGYKAARNALAQHVDEDDKTTALIQCTGSSRTAWRGNATIGTDAPTLCQDPMVQEQAIRLTV